jgi:subtilisin family serine protease
MENGFSRWVTRTGWLAGFLGLIWFSSSHLSFAAAARMAHLQSETLAEHVPGQLIVKLRSANLKSTIAQTLGTEHVLSVEPLVTEPELVKVQLSSEKDLHNSIQALERNPNVAYAEPNFIYHASIASVGGGTPDDPDFAKLWGMNNTGQTDAAGQQGTAGSDIDVLPLWQEGITGSHKVLVAIIDTGIDWTHPDLVDNLYTNPGEAGDLATNGKDDDNDGFIDDVHGWNFQANTNQSSDDHSHGSHCAGPIGGVGNNGQGVVGVNWQVTMMPVKFLDAQGGGSLDGAVNAVNYARMMHVNIMSNSWGGGGFSQALLEAIQKARDEGILFVAAAGNDASNNDATPSYPAAYDVDNIVAVAATDNRDQLASFSNYGPTKVHVAAPGVNVYSSVMGGKYDTYSGTSMATPHVSGIAALMMSYDSSWDYKEIKRRLIATSDPIRSLHRKVVAKGRVNAYNAIHNIVPPSTEPDESAWQTVPYSLESKHPYDINTDQSYTIHVDGAKYLRVIFDKVDVENGYDSITVSEGSGTTVEKLTGQLTNYTTDYLEGDTAVVHFLSDDSVTAWGFQVSQIQVIY